MQTTCPVILPRFNTLPASSHWPVCSISGQSPMLSLIAGRFPGSQLKAMRKAMQLALALPEPPAPPKPTVAIEPQTSRTAHGILVRILAQTVEAAKPKEASDE